MITYVPGNDDSAMVVCGLSCTLCAFFKLGFCLSMRNALSSEIINGHSH